MKKEIHYFFVNGYIDRYLAKYRSNHFKFMLVVKVRFDTKKIFCYFLFVPFRCELQCVHNGINKEKIRCILQFFIDTGENTRQAAEIVNGVHK